MKPEDNLDVDGEPVDLSIFQNILVAIGIGGIILFVWVFCLIVTS